jgi:3-deoxy-D-manno-octulosonic-acid transferase
MARSLGLTAYRALVRRKGAETTQPVTARPEGELVWIHAPEPGSLVAVLDLAARLCTMRYGLKVLITVPQDTPLPDPQDQSTVAPENEVIIVHQPSEHPDNVAAFLEHWHPNTCLWLWGALRPNLVLACSERGCPMILLDADAKGFDRRRDRWLSDLTRRMLPHFDSVLARSEKGKRRLVQLGRASAGVEITSPLVAGGQALTCADTDVSDLTEALGGRPVWFAVTAHRDEVSTILAAHRQAMRYSHRLMLILMPAHPQDAAGVMQAAEEGKFILRNWDEGGYPDDTTQILVASDPVDRALFFRIAPVSFMGSSLVPDPGGFDPFEAAALGSAVLYGPKVRDFMPSYKRLAAAGAARIVNDAAALGTAVSHLIAPDQAAAMAHAGWDVISQGAELTDKVVDLVQDALDRELVR